MSTSAQIKKVFKDLEESLKLNNILNQYEREATTLIAANQPPATANALQWMLAYIRDAKEHYKNGDIDALALAMMRVGAARSNAAFTISKRRTGKRKTAKQCFDELMYELLMQDMTDLPPSYKIMHRLQKRCSENCTHKSPAQSTIYGWIAEKKKLSS